MFHILHFKYSKHLLRHNRTVNDIIHKQLRGFFFFTIVTFASTEVNVHVSLMYNLLHYRIICKPY